MRSFLEFLNEQKKIAQSSKLTGQFLYEAEEKDDALEYEEDGKKIRIIKRDGKYFKQVQEGDTWGKETKSNSEDWTAAESKPGVKSTTVSKPQTEPTTQQKPSKPETGWSGKYEWVDTDGHTHSIEGKKVGDKYIYYKDGKEFDDSNAAKSYKDAVVNKEVAAINRETEKDGEVEASFGYDDDDGHHTITYKVDSKTGKTKPGSFKQDGKPVEDNKLDNIKKELEKKTAAADAAAAEAAERAKKEEWGDQVTDPEDGKVYRQFKDADGKKWTVELDKETGEPIEGSKELGYEKFDKAKQRADRKKAEEEELYQKEKESNSPEEVSNEFSTEENGKKVKYELVKKGKSTFTRKTVEGEEPKNMAGETEFNNAKKRYDSRKPEQEKTETGAAVIDYDKDGNKIVYKTLSDKSVVKKTYKKTDNGFEETPSKSEESSEEEMSAAKTRAQRRAAAENVEPAEDFEDTVETKLPNGETIKIKGIGDGKYVRIKDDGTEDPMDPDTARKLKTAIDNKEQAELIAQINGTNKSDSQSVTTEENGEKVTRVKKTSWDGKVTYQIRRGDGELEDDPQGSDTIFNAAKAKADKDYINKNLKDVEMQAGTLTKVTNDDGSTTIAFKDKDGNYKSYDVPKGEDPKTYKPEKYNDKLTQTEYDELQKTEKEQHKKPADRGNIVKDGEANYTDENGTHWNVKQYENGDVVKQKMKEENGKLVPDGEPEVSKDTGVLKDAQSKQAIERKRAEEAAKKGEQNEVATEFTYNDGEKDVKMKSEKDSNGKMHYYEIDEKGNKKEIDKKAFDKGRDLHDKDVERARKLKQDAEDRQIELQKKAQDKLLDGKDKSDDSKSKEPSDAKKAWDGLLDKMAGSGNIFGQIIGHTGKIITGILATAASGAKKALSKKDDEVTLMELANLRMQLEKNITDAKTEEEKEAAQETLNTIEKATASIVDEKGEPVPMDEREKILRGNMSDEEWEEFKQKNADAFAKMKDTKGFESFNDLSDLSEDQINQIIEYQKKLQKDAHDPKAQEITDELNRKNKEESKRHREKLGSLEAEYDEQKRGLQNYERDVKRAQKDLDKLKREDFDSNEAYEAEKHKRQHKLEDLQNTYNELEEEIKKDYEDKVKEENETHKKNFKKNKEEYEKAAAEIGKDTVESLSKKTQGNGEKETTDTNQDSTEEDDEEQEGDTERELDTSDMEDEDEGNTKQDPHKVWKQKTYKRGKKTMKTKSYYNKKGNSISADEFRKKVQKFEENSAKNEGLGKYLKVRLLNENLNIDKYLNRELKQ